jgi:hypothetical protein
LDSLGRNIDKQKEDDYKLSDIIDYDKIEIASLDNRLIKVFLNDKELGSKNLLQFRYLNQVRDYLKNEIKKDFVFLDSNSHYIPIRDERDISLEEILSKKSIFLECEEEKLQYKRKISHEIFKIIKRVFKHNNNRKMKKIEFKNGLNKKLLDNLKEGKVIKFEKDIFGVYQISDDLILVHTIDNFYIIDIKHNFQLITRKEFD